MKLSIELSKWRCDRPDEWKMDEFIRNAEKLEAERDALAVQVVALKKIAYNADGARQSNSECNYGDEKEWLRHLYNGVSDYDCTNTPEQYLAAHDAEVAKAAYLACLAQCEEYFDSYYEGMVTEADAERYAASLNKCPYQQ